MSDTKQISVVARDHPGLMAEIAEALAAGDINIETVNAETFGNNAVVVIGIDEEKYDEALQIICRLEGLRAVSEEALVLRLDNELGALAKVARRFADAGVNIRSIRFVERDDQHALVAVSVERSPEVLALVKDILVA